MESCGNNSMTGGSSSKNAGAPALGMLTAMAYLSNFRPSQEEVVHTNNNGGGGASLCNNGGDVHASTSYGDGSGVGEGSGVCASACVKNDFGDIGVDFTISEDDIKRYNPELMRLLVNVEGSVVRETENINVGVQGELNESFALIPPPLAFADNASAGYDSDSEFQPSSNKKFKSGSSSAKKVKNSQPGPSTISTPAHVKISNSNKSKVVKSQKGNDYPILREILERQKSVPALLSPINDKKNKNVKKSNKGKEQVTKSVVRKPPKPSTSTTVVDQVTTDRRQSSDSESDSDIFSQAEDRRTFNDFRKLRDKMIRQRVEKTAARGGDTKLREVARRAIDTAKKYIISAEKEIAAAEREIAIGEEKKTAAIRTITAAKKIIAHNKNLLSGTDERVRAELRFDRKWREFEKLNLR